MDDVTPILFDGWEPVVRAAILTPAAYAALILFLRISGKRTLSQLNVFDWVVTVALGSTLATIIVGEGVALAQGLVALGGLIALQFVVALVSSRVPGADRVVKSEPRLLVRGGELLEDAMRDERVSEEEILQAVRSHGFPTIETVEAVILETNGTLSVLAERTESGELPSVSRAL